MTELIEKAVKNLSPTTSRFKVMIYLSFKGPSRPNQITEETEIPSGTVRPALRFLLDRGFVTQQSDGTYRSNIAFTEIISDLYTRLEKN